MKKPKHERVLLSSVIRPFGGQGEGDSVGAELFHAQITRAQGLFSLRQVIRCWAIDYIAENIETPCVVLHYPSLKEFKKEITENFYDYIGLNFVVSTFHKLKQMVQVIREASPFSKIILGGYGTVLPDDELDPYGDYICRQEGISFMRELLHEGPLLKVTHPYAPIDSVKLYSYQQSHKVGHITSGLGCPNGCDFCCTSHFFNRKYLPFSKSGRDIYEAICRLEKISKEKGDCLNGYIIIDEDFFLHKRRAREFLDCVRENKKTFQLMGFGSIRGLSQFEASEIAEMGFETIWTAFEGTESGYGKLKGKSISDLYTSLKEHGISILSSMIIGFPYQDQKQIEKEFKMLMDLKPSLTQFLIYFAFHNTPFYREVVQEGRYLKEYQDNPDYRRWDGFSMHFKHQHFDSNALEKLQKELYQNDFSTLGPSIVRIYEVWYQGYLTLKDSRNNLLKTRAEIKKQELISGLPALIPAILMGPNFKTKKKAYQLFKKIKKLEPKFNFKLFFECLGVPLLAAWTSIKRRIGIYGQPKLLRIEHRNGAFVLQGSPEVKKEKG